MALRTTKARQGAGQGQIQTNTTTVLIRDLIRRMLSKEDSMKADSCKVVISKIGITPSRLCLGSLKIAAYPLKDTD